MNCDVDAVQGNPLIDYGVVSFGVPETALVVIRNEADGNAPLRVDSAAVTSDSSALEADFQVRLFFYDTDGVTTIDATPPIFLSAGDPALALDPDLLYAEVTFGANVAGVVTNTRLIVSMTNR